MGEPQVLVPRGVWFAAKPLDSEGFSLVGTTVTPGFVYEDFELPKREVLIRRFPQHKEVIEDFTRE